MQYTKYRNDEPIRFHSNQTARMSQQQSTAARASAAPSIATAGGAGGLFLDVRDRKLAQRILDDLADHVQLVVARYGLQVRPVFSVNAVPRRFFARLDHVEHGNLVRVTCQCIPALDAVMRE